MKITHILGIVGAVALLAGCNQNADNSTPATSASSDAANRASYAGNAASNAVSPTSRSLDSASRTYQSATNAAGKDVDNTAQNVRDRADQSLTPGDQGGSPADRETTRKIRRAITSNDQLSTTAKNIKIMTVDGKVTLRGPVKTEEEKKQITDLAASVVQPDKLDNQLEVKAATSPTSTDNK